MKIEKMLFNTPLIFNHYPSILNRKEVFGPVLSYQKNDSIWFRIDVSTNRAILPEKQVKYNWQLQCKMGHSSLIHSFCSFQDAYNALKNEMMLQRIRLLYL